MARGLCVGIVMAMFVIAGDARVLAAPVPIDRGADVKFTLGKTAAESTVVAEGLGVRITKRVGPEIVKIRIEVPKDVVELEARPSGDVRVSRRGQSLVIALANRDQHLLARARRMMEGSPALKSFGALIAALDTDERAVATSMRTTWALVNAVRGNDDIVMSIARRVTSAARKGPFTPVSFTREEGPTACWAEYSETVNVYYGEFASCLVNYAWIPGAAQACTVEWAIKSELAWFWLIECDGGLPR